MDLNRSPSFTLLHQLEQDFKRIKSQLTDSRDAANEDSPPLTPTASLPRDLRL